MLTIAEAADRLQVTTDTIYNWHKAGRICIIFDDPRKRYVSVADVEKMESEKIPDRCKKCSLCNGMDKEELFKPGHSKHIECYESQLKKKWAEKKNQHSVNRKRAYEKDPSKAIERAKKNYKKNPEPVKARASEQYYKNKEEICMNRKFKKYNITADEYDELKSKTNGLCEICGVVPERECIDHDHVSGKVRGLLCHVCNSGIGFLKDDPAIIAKAASYLNSRNKDTFKQNYCDHFYGGC